jgi:thiosulfate/3-mercaptopyruvate sulfurtransferase
VHPSYFESGLDTTKYYPNYSCPDDGNLLPDIELHNAIADLGIGEDTLVVVYGKGYISTMVACRAVWSLMYAGVKDVRMLNGGFSAWQKAKCMTQATPDEPASIPLFTSNKETKPKSKFLATTA